MQNKGVNDQAVDGAAKPLAYGESPAAQAAAAASGLAAGSRRLENVREPSSRRREPPQKEGKNVRYTHSIVVTITKPQIYHFDEKLIQKLVNQGSFDLLSDGREQTHGPVKISSFYLRDNPKYARWSMQSSVMPWVAGGLACALLTVSVVAYRRLRRPDNYIKVEEEDNGGEEA